MGSVTHSVSNKGILPFECRQRNKGHNTQNIRNNTQTFIYRKPRQTAKCSPEKKNLDEWFYVGGSTNTMLHGFRRAIY